MHHLIAKVLRGQWINGTCTRVNFVEGIADGFGLAFPLTAERKGFIPYLHRVHATTLLDVYACIHAWGTHA